MTKNKLLLLLVLLAAVATGAWADTTVTWTESDMSELYIDFKNGAANNNTIKGITATASAGGKGDWFASIINATGATTITFTSSVGNIKSIVIKAEDIYIYSDIPAGWTLSDKLSWSGEASTTVSMALSDHQGIESISEIVFTIEPTTYSVTLAEGTEDADKWKVKVGKGEAQAFPVEGLNGGETVTVTYNGSREVKNVTVVKKAAANPNAYMKWDNTKKELVATEMPESFTTVTSSTTTWEAGTYVVEGDVTIGGMIELKGAVNLIIKDGAKLTVNSYINGDFKNLSIYGQAKKTGQLVVNCSNNHAISGLSTLEVHSAEVTATASGNNSHGGISSIDKFNVYGGLVDAKTTAADGGYGISLSGGGSMDIYGGEVKAEGKGTGDWDCGIVCGSFDKAPVTVHGGKLWAGNADNKALNFVTLTIDKSPSFNVEIECSSDNSTWHETVGTPDSEYVRVGY